MSKHRYSTLLLSGFTILLLAGTALLVSAATPANGTLTADNRTVTYEAGPFVVSNPSIQISSEPICDPNPEGQVCDDFELTVDLPAGFTTSSPDDRISVVIDWDDALNDFDMFVFDENGSEVDRSATGNKPEIVILPPEDGQRRFSVVVEPFLVAGESFRGTITLAPPAEPPPPPGDPSLAPRYMIYPAPPELGNRFQDEPGIGANWFTGNVMFQALLDTLRVNFDDATSPAMDDWVKVNAPNTDKQSFDPILFTDHATGRTFVSQLVLACSLMSFSDDDGETWAPSEGCGPGAEFDHQAVGVGPFAPPLTGGTPLYPNAVYYCAQDSASAKCAVSLDGGMTFGPGVPMYDLTECGGLHGHIEVAPDGTAYTPNKSCSPNQAVVVSEDNGLSWNVRRVPGSAPGGTDPAIGIATDGTLYFGYQNGDGRPRIAVSHDKGLTWQHDQAVGGELQVVKGVFPAVVAGDPDRAAFAFYGTTTAGNSTSADFRGDWHLYVAHTFDGGESWTTVNVTGDDPIQRGCIWEGGGGVPCRNLLDFFGIDVDAEGRVLVGYVDGCINACAESWPNTFGAFSTIARLEGGKRLFAAFDPVEPMPPGAPRLNTAFRLNDETVDLDWDTPDNGGAAISEQRVYRSLNGAPETLLVKLGAAVTEFTDPDAPVDAALEYRISAVNAEGEGPRGNGLAPVPLPPAPPANPCVAPGALVNSDAAGDQVIAPFNPYFDIQSISVAEPFFAAGENKLVFTLKTADLSVLPPDTRWQVDFVGQDGVQYWVNMNTESGPEPVFQFGLAGAINVVIGVGVDITLGEAEPESNFSPDGTITLVVRNEDVGGSRAGDHLEAITGVVKTEAQVSGTARRVNTNDEAAIKASYFLVGNDACRVPEAVDVTSEVELLTSNPSFSSTTAAFDLRLRNRSADSLFAPLRTELVALDSASGSVSAANADNGETGTAAFWRYDDRLGGDAELAPGETSDARRLVFDNPNREAFSVTLRVLSGPEQDAAANGGTGPSLTEALVRVSVNPLLGLVDVELLN
jgi:hypothetical protein